MNPINSMKPALPPTPHRCVQCLCVCVCMHEQTVCSLFLLHVSVHCVCLCLLHFTHTHFLLENGTLEPLNFLICHSFPHVPRRLEPCLTTLLAAYQYRRSSTYLLRIAFKRPQATSEMYFINCCVASSCSSALSALYMCLVVKEHN